jgi:hypothetical protein
MSNVEQTPSDLVEMYIRATAEIEDLVERRRLTAGTRAYAVMALQELGYSLQQIAEAVDRSKNAVVKAASLPQRFLLQHLDLSGRVGAVNALVQAATLDEVMQKADGLWNPDVLGVRQEIIDSETGEWRFRGGGDPNWSPATRRRTIPPARSAHELKAGDMESIVNSEHDDKRIFQAADGIWGFYCPHRPGDTQFVPFETEVQARQYAVHHDRAIHQGHTELED